MSYPKAIDYWYSVCMLLVYGALVEYVLVNFLSTREKRLCRLMQEEMDDDTFDEGGDVLKEVIVVSDTVVRTLIADVNVSRLKCYFLKKLSRK